VALIIIADKTNKHTVKHCTFDVAVKIPMHL